MRLLNKFLVIEFLKVFLFLFLLTFIFLNVIEFFERYSTFFGHKKPIFLFFKYLFWKGLVNIFQIFPYILSFSSILTMFYLSRTKELLALLSLGYSKKNIFNILLLSVFVINFFLGILINYVSAQAYQNAVDVWEREILGKKKKLIFLKEKLIFEGENYLLISHPLEPNAEYLGDVLYLALDKNGEIEEVIWAKGMLYSNGSWILENSIVQKSSEDFIPKKFDKHTRHLPFNPSTLVVVEKTLKFLTIDELYKRYQFLSKVGKSTKEVKIEFLYRFYYLFVGFLISLWSIYVYLKFYTPINSSKAIGISLLVYIFLSLINLMIFSFIYNATIISILILAILNLISVSFLVREKALKASLR